MLDFLNESNPFSVYSNVESPKITKFSLPLGDIDLDGTGLYIGDNGTVQAENNLSTQQQSKFNINNTKEYQPLQEEEEATKPVSTTGNGKKAYDFFISKGLSSHQARGIVGNLKAESGLNHTAVNPSSKAFGLAQWLGDRKKKLFSKYGKNPTFDQQLEFIWEELNSTERKSLDYLLQTKNTKDATISFMNLFERPSKEEKASSVINRIKFANSI